ncbi:MAG: hypothetical protein B6240_12350, partial [Desulfobacteraceae bacterium 4572_87]
MKQLVYRCSKGSTTKPMLLFVLVVVMLVAAPNGFVWEGKNMANASEIVTRQAHGSGRWFPGNKQELKEMVESYIENAQPSPVKGRIVAAMAPH